MPDVLVINAGSTSVKLARVDGDGRSRAAGAIPDTSAGLEAVGHRVVHGGGRFTAPALLDDAAMAALEDAATLAPLHNRPALELAREARAALPDVPHVAVFDTAFHATMPDEAATFAVPAEWRDRHRVRRYGFHGLSVEWAAGRAAQMLGAAPRLVVCHLGGGASATAVRDGRSVDTTMGMTPLAGLVMASRSGDLDPEVPLHMVLRGGMEPAQVEDALNHRSGLVGLAGTPDMRAVEDAAGGGDPAAALALAVHDHRLAGAVAAMAAALGGLDVLAFTGGIGEHSPRTRAAAAARLSFLGVAIDERANADADGDRDISAGGAAVRTLVVRAREDLVVARAVRGLISRNRTPGREP